MSWTGITAFLHQVLSFQLFTLGGTVVTPQTILTILVILLITSLLSRLSRRGLHSLYQHRDATDQRSVGAIARLVHFSILLVGIGVALQTAGFNLNALFAAGALFAVGIGFAMQNIMQNFVAGVILLAERAIKPGDVLEVDGKVVKVISMGIRTTIVLTRDSENLIVPNSTLAQSTVKNYTLKDAVYRLRAPVGVLYSSDLRLVRRTLERAAQAIDWRLPDREPVVLLTDFGDSSVNFEVSVWMSDPWEARPGLSRLNEAVWWALQEAGIVIAFPQLDVHLDPEVTEGLRARAAG